VVGLSIGREGSGTLCLRRDASEADELRLAAPLPSLEPNKVRRCSIALSAYEIEERFITS
jgi:hypothetical protein